MNGFKRIQFVAFGLGVTLLAFSTVYFAVTGFAAEVSKESKDKEEAHTAKSKSYSGGGHNFPPNAFEYAKLIEPILGVPPKVDLGAGVELPLYIDGVQARGYLGFDCDNPSRIGKGCISGSVLQRHEGVTADGEPIPEVVWVSFGRNASFTYNGKTRVNGSVQMIGYHMETGATAFFESSDKIDPWATIDPETERLLGEMPWIDNPEEFNRAFRTPRDIQCVECHQNDPYIHNSFVDAAKMPGTNTPVLPELDDDSPYYVIGGENWDMRTIHIEGNACFDCHRVGMGTVKLFMRYEWDANDYMPPRHPGSKAEDLRALLEAWENTPENTPGAEWVIPPARGEERRIVGDDYPFKAAFNIPGNEALAQPGVGQAKSFGKEDKGKERRSKGGDSSPRMSKEELLKSMVDKGMTDEEIEAYFEMKSEEKKSVSKKSSGA